MAEMLPDPFFDPCGMKRQPHRSWQDKASPKSSEIVQGVPAFQSVPVFQDQDLADLLALLAAWKLFTGSRCQPLRPLCKPKESFAARRAPTEDMSWCLSCPKRLQSTTVCNSLQQSATVCNSLQAQSWTSNDIEHQLGQEKPSPSMNSMHCD